jgi:Ca2+-binding RTX toxin-like protein
VRLVVGCVLVAVVAAIWGTGPAAAAFPGANGKIAFRGFDGVAGIFLVDPEPGATAEHLVDAYPYDDPPAWSPDGSKIAFADSGGLYIVDAQASQQPVLLVSSAGGGPSHPTWSPDGARIAFQRLDDIYVVSALGGPVTQLVANAGGYNEDPAWSPDGTQIAFVSNREAYDETIPEDDAEIAIYVTEVQGGGPAIKLTPGGHPSWSPDGTKIAFGGGGIRVIDVGTGAITPLTTFPCPEYRPAWSPDGTKIAFTRRCEGEGYSIYLMNADGSAQTRIAAGSDPDWQPLASPIVFIHGFLGSRITCGEDELWPRIPLPPRLLDMRLAADGVSNLPGTCGAQVGGIVDSVAGSDIYESTVDFLEQIAPGRNHVFTWDWRTSPAQSLALLDAFVEDVRTQHGGAKVVLMAHSMGGLLARWYIDEQARADKVARVLTIGTPYWGAPKSLFPLAAGIETPQGSTLDVFFDNGELQDFARNLLGLYFLYPSESYGDWLTLAAPGPGTLDRAGLLDYVGNTLDGNAALLAQALDRHADTLDGFETNGVDYRVVAGSGLNTISRVTVLENEVGVQYTSGDRTVPVRSAVQGAPGTGDPLGEDVPISYACGIGHVPLPGNAQVDAAIEGFLLGGADIEGLSGAPCGSSGFQIEIFPVAVPLSSAVRGLTSGTAVSLADAELQGLVQVLEFPGQTIVVTDASRPVDLALPAGPSRIEVTPLMGEVEGEPQSYGPLGGEVTISASSELAVFEDGQPVEPGGDTTPPTVVGVPDRAPNPAGWYSGPVTIDWQATDDSGSASDPPDTIASTAGEGVVYTSDESCDPSGNCAAGTLVLSIDLTAPAVSVPGDFEMDATGPAGAEVSYQASASDDLDPSPSLVCEPASGGVFPIGATDVTCTATDAAGNSASATFTVTVLPEPGGELLCQGLVPTIVGSDAGELIVGTLGDDVILALGGDDRIWPGAGNDVVCAGAGDDRVHGGLGADRFDGGEGDDVLVGGIGADVLSGGGGDDVLEGMAGKDTIEGGEGDDSAFGGVGDDSLDGGSGTDGLDGGLGRDSCANGETVVRCEQ